MVELTYIDINVPNLAVYNGYTLSQCESACASTVGCVAFVVDCSAGSQCGGSTPYQCYLKSALGTSNIRATNVEVSLIRLSGRYVPLVGIDFYGDDIGSFVNTMQDCISACDSTPGCGMFSSLFSYPLIGSSANLCYLKTNTNIDWKFNDGNQSYVIPRTTTSGMHSMFVCVPCPAGEELY